MSVLQKIIEHKKLEIISAKEQRPLAQIQSQLKSQPSEQSVRLSFCQALRQAAFPAIIAEVKKASPSKGVIRPDLNHLDCAEAYVRGGATCLSVLTDESFFQGHLNFLREIRAQHPQIPLLRKDFTLDPYQVWESKLAGANAILLIVQALESSLLSALIRESQEAQLEVLIEVHNAEELKLLFGILPSQTSGLMLGINNRDLNTFKTNLEVTHQLISLLRQEQEQRKDIAWCRDLLIVSESGIFTGQDLSMLHTWGAQAFLIGESLVREGNIQQNLEQLIIAAREKTLM